jgi:hypothetical protein
MAARTISDVDAKTLGLLRDRATAPGRTPESDVIIEDHLRVSAAPVWDWVNEFRARLARSGHPFGDSIDLLREDRDR